MYEDIDEIGDLLDIEQQIDEELGDLGDLGAATPAKRRRGVMVKRKKRNVQTRLKLVGARIGGVNPRRLRGLIPTIRPLYANYRVAAAAALVNGTEFEFFGKGLGDAGSNLGWTDNKLTTRHTNIGQEGKLPNNELFFLYGIGFGLQMLPGGAGGFAPHEVDPIDLFHFGNLSFRYEEGQGTRSTLLGRVLEAPASHYHALELGVHGDSAAASPTVKVRDAVRFAGEMFRRRRPMFVIQGGDKNEQNKIIARVHETVAALARISSTNPAQFSCSGFGIWWQHPTKNISQ